MAACALAGLALDQVTKEWAIRALEPATPQPLLGEFLQLYLTRNPGAAFSMGESATLIFTILSIAVLAFLLIGMLPRLRHIGWGGVLGLLAGGVAGNLVDRIGRPPALFHGHVVDFLMLPRWPIFNIADSLIVAAAIGVVALSFFGTVGPSGRPFDEGAPSPGSAGNPDHPDDPEGRDDPEDPDDLEDPDEKEAVR